MCQCCFNKIWLVILSLSNNPERFLNIQLNVNTNWWNMSLKGLAVVFGDNFCMRVWGVCLSWICRDDFFSLCFPLAVKLIGLQTGCQFFKNVHFFDNPPLKCFIIYVLDFWPMPVECKMSMWLILISFLGVVERGFTNINENSWIIYKIIDFIFGFLTVSCSVSKVVIVNGNLFPGSSGERRVDVLQQPRRRELGRETAGLQVPGPLQSDDDHWGWRRHIYNPVQWRYLP